MDESFSKSYSMSYISIRLLKIVGGRKGHSEILGVHINRVKPLSDLHDCLETALKDISLSKTKVISYYLN